MSGHVIGALVTTAIRRSVICSLDGSDARFTFDCTTLAEACAAASPSSAIAAPALEPSVLKNERRSTDARRSSSRSLRTIGFMGAPWIVSGLRATDYGLRASSSLAPQSQCHCLEAEIRVVALATDYGLDYRPSKPLASPVACSL